MQNKRALREWALQVSRARVAVALLAVAPLLAPSAPAEAQASAEAQLTADTQLAADTQLTEALGSPRMTCAPRVPTAEESTATRGHEHLLLSQGIDGGSRAATALYITAIPHLAVGAASAVVAVFAELGSGIWDGGFMVGGVVSTGIFGGLGLALLAVAIALDVDSAHRREALELRLSTRGVAIGGRF